MTITIVVPVHNEVSILEKNIRQLHAFMERASADYDWNIFIAENGSTDESAAISMSLAKKLPRISVSSTQSAGKGEAVLHAWTDASADISLFIDADLAPDLTIIPKLIDKIDQGFDIAIGSRALPGSQISRTAVRRFFSYANNLLRAWLFRLPIKDTACGVKAINRRTLEQIVPLIKNQSWFFDTELVILAHAKGFRIAEVPVTWHDRTKKEGGSKIRLLSTSGQYLREMLRLKKASKKTSI